MAYSGRSGTGNTCSGWKKRIFGRAQVSVEYLMIIGLSFAILLPAGYFFYNYSRSSNENSIRQQISQLGNTILSNSESIYGLAEGSVLTADLKYPKNVIDIYIIGKRELVIKYEISSGTNEAVFFSNIDLSGNYTYPGRAACGAPPCTDSTISQSLPQPGRHQLQFASKTNYVLLLSVS